jgi:sugar phosphate isomerase/epimerase
MDGKLANEAAIRAPVLEVIDRMLERLAPAWLDGVELWYNHIWPGTITPVMAGEIRKRLAARDMVCCACAGSPGNPNLDIYGSEARFQTANLLHAPLIAGDVSSGALRELNHLCARYQVRLAYENHPEQEAKQILEVIQEGSEWIGVALDTGSLVQRGGDPAQAIGEIGNRLMHVHLRDVPALGSDKSVAIGTGLVDTPAVIRELQKRGYDGWLSIEVPIEDHDPTEAILASAETIRQFWNR